MLMLIEVLYKHSSQFGTDRSANQSTLHGSWIKNTDSFVNQCVVCIIASELKSDRILFFFQCNEVSSSNAMEKEGLARNMRHLDAEGVLVDNLVTDRHPRVRKYMANTRPETKHYFDVWHMAKGKLSSCNDIDPTNNISKLFVSSNCFM